MEGTIEEQDTVRIGAGKQRWIVEAIQGDSCEVSWCRRVDRNTTRTRTRTEQRSNLTLVRKGNTDQDACKKLGWHGTNLCCCGVRPQPAS